MSAADVGAVDVALVARLVADATLAAFVPDGVFVDVAPADKTRFVIVQAQTHEDTEGLGDTLYQVCRYRITARLLETMGTNANAAAFRIHQILTLTDLAIDGYAHMATLRVERVKLTEVDAIDNDIRWQWAGGDYEIWVSPTTTGIPSEFTPTFHGLAFDTT